MPTTHAEEATRTTPERAPDAAAALLDALTTRHFDALRLLLAEDVQFRMLVPSGLMVDQGAEDTVTRLGSWFDDADPFLVEATSSHDVAGRPTVSYRFRLARAGRSQVIEQHLMLDVGADGLVSAIDLLCSGFRTIAADDPDQVHRYDAGDLGCADGLAGAFREQIRSIPVGHLLVVSTRDPAAKEDLPSLARLMGHVVRSTEASDDGRLLVTVERR